MRAPQDEDGRARGSSPNRFGHSNLTMSNSPSRSRGAFLRPGLATLLHSPRTRGGRSADPPPVHPHAAPSCPRLLRRLSFLLLRPPHAASTILRAHPLEPG